MSMSKVGWLRALDCAALCGIHEGLGFNLQPASPQRTSRSSLYRPR